MLPLLEQTAESLNYGEVPETWRVPDIDRFSAEKTLYDYQAEALRNAARALYLYYGKAHDWRADEAVAVNDERKRSFKAIYADAGLPSIKKYETKADKNNGRQNPVFRILSRYIRHLELSRGDEISYYNLINRMCFWMATGSGKTLVMVKLIEYLHALIKHGEIPPHRMLLLAPSEHLLGQIKRAVAEFNDAGLYIDLIPLREAHRSRQARLGEVATVYYHRSDNIADVQREALTDYREYENDGRWYVLLDEAHKGGKENSKRQAYYAVMAREGFLFNFSATFTDAEDIATTVKKYNLENFIRKGHGKNIYLNEQEYAAFNNSSEEISHADRRRIVLKSLLSLAAVSQQVKALRRAAGRDDLYHAPLMLTLVNSVNTDMDKNDLWAFFQTLRELATGEIDHDFFNEAKTELMEDWRQASLLFQQANARMDDAGLAEMNIASLRAAVFLSGRAGALQFVRSGDDKELALQLKNAAAPFALIRIGNTSKWRNTLLAGYEETAALREKSFFAELEQSPITLLMGSRSFFESWDSNRPNVINFINIGGFDAKKFVVQSVGRGVRIEPLPGQRRRLSSLQSDNARAIRAAVSQGGLEEALPETLFLFATNRRAVKAVLEGLEAEKPKGFETLDGFALAARPMIGGVAMPLLVPRYKDLEQAADRHPFALAEKTLERFKTWLGQTSDSIFAVRDGLAAGQITELRAAAMGEGALTITPNKNYALLAFLQQRLIAHLARPVKVSDGVRKMDAEKDIVHFQHIRVHSDYVRELQAKINQVKAGWTSNENIVELAEKMDKGEVTRTEFNAKTVGKDQDAFKDLTIKKILNHYYLPVVLGNEKANYIQHIIKVHSEVKFLNRLEAWLENHQPDWDSWMFSKLDEALDQVHIPYYDIKENEYRRFLPDFVFWMCKGNKYRIVFVDPKGDAHADSYHKIDGYKKLFLEDGNPRRFQHERYEVSVKLLYYKPDAKPPEEYKAYWITDPAAIFADNGSETQSLVR